MSDVTGSSNEMVIQAAERLLACLNEFGDCKHCGEYADILETRINALKRQGATVTRLPARNSHIAPISDRVDELVGELQRQGMKSLRASFKGMRVRIDPEESHTDEPATALSNENLLDELIGMVEEAARDRSVTACKAFEEASAKEIDAARDRVLATMRPSPPPGVVACSRGGDMTADDLDVLVDHLSWPQPIAFDLYRAQVAILHLIKMMRPSPTKGGE